MDRFLKRSTPDPPRTPSPKPSKAAKQGNVTAVQRAAEFGATFYADGGKLFCRPCNSVVNHIRKSIIDNYLASKVSTGLILSLSQNYLHQLISEVKEDA